jgi:hypothetical protein
MSPPRSRSVYCTDAARGQRGAYRMSPVVASPDAMPRVVTGLESAGPVRIAKVDPTFWIAFRRIGKRDGNGSANAVWRSCLLGWCWERVMDIPLTARTARLTAPAHYELSTTYKILQNVVDSMRIVRTLVT